MKIIISGANSIGIHLSKLLSRDREDIVLIDEDEETLSGMSNDLDLMTVNASPTSIQTLKEAGIANADLFVAVQADENVNTASCSIAKALGAKKTIARIDNPEYMSPEVQKVFTDIGIDDLIYPELLAANDIVKSLKFSWARLRWDVYNGELIMLGIKLREGCEILNQTLMELARHEEPFHIVAIKRKGHTLIPKGGDQLMLGDIAYFMTVKEKIPYIKKLVGKDGYEDVKNVIIMGGGKTAVRTAKLIPDNMNVKIIEKDEHRCEKLNELIDRENVLVINGDGRDLSLLSEEGIKNTQAFIALTNNTETNILSCLAAKRFGVRKTVAMVDNIDYVSMAESLDIGTLVNKRTISAGHIYQMMLQGEVRNVKFMMTAHADVAEFIVHEGAKITKKLVKDLKLPPEMTIGGLVRDNVGTLVNGNTQILPGDRVVVFCYETMIRKIEKLFH
ncbi:MAG: Trk system potassium transporter TrkA [Bacteroidaceae bacterium]|nr:Trk system potassium transporter TrkA [Bacteroidaceae bacterium]